MKKTKQPLPDGSLPLLAIENLQTERPNIMWKHKSKHMAFSSKEGASGDPREVILRSDGVAYDPDTGTFYQTPLFDK